MSFSTNSKPVEPEAEYDFYGVIPLTHRKAKGIIKDRGYNVTGFVLTREDGDKCIVDMSAVRWLTDKEFFEMMHPPVVSPTTEPEAEPVAWNDITSAELRDLHLEEQFGLFCDTDEFIEISRAVIAKFKYRNLHPPKPAEPAARKPMTQEEIIQGVTVDTSDDFHAGYWAGIRWAERHHGIGESE